MHKKQVQRMMNLYLLGEHKREKNVRIGYCIGETKTKVLFPYLSTR